MENKVLQAYSLKITTFSPVHIGDNVDFEPTEYIIANSDTAVQTAPKSAETEDFIICPECGYKNNIAKLDKKMPQCLDCESDLELPEHIAKKESEKLPANSTPSYLYTFTPKQMAEALSDIDKKKLLTVAREGDYTSLQKFFKDNTSKIIKTAVKHSKVCPEVAKQYADKCGNMDVPQKERNQFKIEKNICNLATDLAYIPGSSLKGAIRTALMSERNQSLHLDSEKYKKGAQAEKQLYSYFDVNEDPFKYLKIGDSTPQNAYLTEICVAKNYKRRTGETQMPVSIEVIPHDTAFTTELSLAENSFAKVPTHKKLPDTMSDIRTACNNFYGDILAYEQSYIKQPALYTKLKQASQKQNAFIIRIGKHSGAESVTIDGLRRIKNRKTGGFMSHSTTYWLAEDEREKLPFGWCVVEYDEVK